MKLRIICLYIQIVNFEVTYDRAFQNPNVSQSQIKSSLKLKMVLKPFRTEEAIETWLGQSV